MTKVAIVYDRVNKWGGAERVLLALHEIYPMAPLYTSVYDKKNAPWANVFPKVIPSFLQKIPFARANHELLAPLMPLAFESFDFSDFDLVISVTSEAAKGIKTGPNTTHVCYCLTPTRYLWSGYGDYFKDPIFKAASKPIIAVLRRWDKVASKRPDAMVAISAEVKKRIKKYYGRNSEIIYPPVELSMNRFIDSKNAGKSYKKYFLLVSRLDFGYKKVDLAIKAFNKLGYPLIVVGTGRLEKQLKRLAKNNIKFVGKVSDKKLHSYYVGTKALIMPQEEDFGIVAVEAQNFGIPVIAYKKGGALDTIIENKTGIFFKTQNVTDVIKAIRRFESMKFNKQTVKSGAQAFTKKIFQKRIFDLVTKYNRI